MKYNIIETKIFFSIKPKSRDASKLNANIKAARPIFYINAFQISISDTGMKDLGETIFESTFYLQFFASLTSDSLANWGSSHLKEMPKLDKCNLKKIV